VVLVEGVSDRTALEVLAARRGRDLEAEGIGIVAMDGATNIPRFLERYGPRGSDLRVVALCDAQEEPVFRQACERAGVDQQGVFVCRDDLEEELIRALGPAGVEQVITGQGELASWRTFQRQPAQRGRTVEQHLRRFMGTRSGRKAQYARALVEALDLDRVPAPLDAALAHASVPGGREHLPSQG